MCVLGIPKGKFSKQMKKKKLSYRIIRIKRIFSGVYWCITWTKSLTNLHKSPSHFSGVYWCITWTKSLTTCIKILRTFICLWVNWSRLYINQLRKKCVYSYNKGLLYSQNELFLSQGIGLWCLMMSLWMCLEPHDCWWCYEPRLRVYWDWK